MRSTPGADPRWVLAFTNSGVLVLANLGEDPGTVPSTVVR